MDSRVSLVLSFLHCLLLLRTLFHRKSCRWHYRNSFDILHRCITNIFQKQPRIYFSKLSVDVLLHTTPNHAFTGVTWKPTSHRRRHQKLACLWSPRSRINNSRDANRITLTNAHRRVRLKKIN